MAAVEKSAQQTRKSEGELLDYFVSEQGQTFLKIFDGAADASKGGRIADQMKKLALENPPLDGAPSP